MNGDRNRQFGWFVMGLIAASAGCAAQRGVPAGTAPVREAQAPTVQVGTLPTVAIITTGGTIAQKFDAQAGGLVPAVSGAALVEAVPALKELARLRVIPLVNIDSRDMTPELWLRLARLVNETLAEPAVAGVVVTHGTDTMEDTAYVLDLTVASDKPVVLTGAQRDASTPDADGPRNLLNAVRQVVDADAGGRGVTLTFDSKIFYARPVTKCHTNHVNAFAAGYYGQAGEIDDEQVTWFGRPERGPRFAIPDELPKVELIYVYPGADSHLIDAALSRGAAGIVVCGYGIGNVDLPVFQAIERARKKGVAVVLTTRVAEGRVYPVYGGEGGGTSMKNLGVVFGADLLPWKARILLMLALT
ncbi:MAG: asparaginase, partial [Planctomycetes bacterium]|nr:asparaginase [Planctomycetota bacterium]